MTNASVSAPQINWSLVLGHWSLVIFEFEARLNSTAPKSWLPFLLLAAALVVWAALFALGAFLERGADQPRHDLRKPLVILGTMATFLAVWGLALWLRSRKIRHK
ncbi:MAG: hypothetical protein WD738_10585 [Pirellulales bacterium]